MGLTFHRVLIQSKGPSSLLKLKSAVPKAAKALGYQVCTEGHGIKVTVSLQHSDSEWLDVESPLLEEASETYEQFLQALAQESELPMLSIDCVDSDWSLCRLIDASKGTNTLACIGEIPEPVAEPDYNAWVASCKKKWKCEARAFQSVFEGQYVFAEDGLEELATILHFYPAIPEENEALELEGITFWFSASSEMAEAIRPKTLEEKIADFIEGEYAELLLKKGYRRYRNSSLRWHKCTGTPGNEIILSIVITTRFGHVIEPIYGAQSLYCPMVFSDKYFPHHDQPTYWKEAQFEFLKLGWDPMFIPDRIAPGIGAYTSFHDPEQLRPYLDELIIPELDRVTDFEASRSWNSVSDKKWAGCYDNSDRVWIESIIAGDIDTVNRISQKRKNFYEERNMQWISREREKDENMIQAFETGGIEACRAILEETYQSNMRKLRRAGIID